MRDHPIEQPLPTVEERRVAEKVLGMCLHWHWTRSIEQYAQYANCATCGKRLYLGGNLEPDPKPAAISAMWLNLLPRPATDEAAASVVLSKLEEKGWSIEFTQAGGLIACVLQKDQIRVESGTHPTRAAAITEAAAKTV